MTKNKENALIDFMNMIVDSWTWARMTHEERQRCTDGLCRAHLNGTWLQRWQTLNDLYYSFLLGLNYAPSGWREKEEAPGF